MTVVEKNNIEICFTEFSNLISQLGGSLSLQIPGRLKPEQSTTKLTSKKMTQTM